PKQELASVHASERRGRATALCPDDRQLRRSAAVVEDRRAVTTLGRRDRAVEHEVGRAVELALLAEDRWCSCGDLVPAHHGATTRTVDGVLGPDALRPASARVVDGHGLGEASIERVDREGRSGLRRRSRDVEGRYGHRAIGYER